MPPLKTRKRFNGGSIHSALEKIQKRLPKETFVQNLERVFLLSKDWENNKLFN